jgi:O-antigen polymerase
MTQTTGLNNRLTRWLIVTAMTTFTLALHVTFPNMGGAGLRLPFNATVWMGFSLMIAISLWPMTRGVIRYSSFHVGLGILVAILWLPFFWSWGEASLIALPRLLGLTAGALLLLGLAQLELTRRHWWWLGMSIFAGTLIETAYAYIQQFVLEPGNWVGYDPSYGRPYGIFQQPNVLASFLATGLAISAWLYHESRNRIEAGITLFAPLFMPAILLILMSRTGWLATIIVVPMVLFYLWHQSRQRFLIWGSVFLVGCLFALFINSVGEAARSDDAIQSSGERYYVYTHGLRMIMEKPFLGWGYGRFQHDFLYSFADWRAAQPINQPDIVEPFIKLNYSHPHNELLLWGIEGGLLPVMALLAFAGWIAWQLFRHGPKGKRLMLAATIAPLILHSMTEYPFYHSQASWLCFLIFTGLISSNAFSIKQRSYRYTFSVKIIACLAMPLTIIFMATTLQSLLAIEKYLESGNKDVSELSNITNPLAISREANFLTMTHQANNAIAMKMDGMIEAYLEWAESQHAAQTDKQTLEKMARAYSALGQDQAASTTMTTLNHLFP